MQRARFTQAAQGGQSGQWLAAHPGIQQRVAAANPTGGQATRIQNFMGTGQSQRANLPRNMPRPPVGQPQRGGPMMAPRQPVQTQPLGASVPGYNAVNGGMQSVINNRVRGYPGYDTIATFPGGGGGMGGWSGDNASMQQGLQGMAGGQMGGWSGDNAAQQPYLAGLAQRWQQAQPMSGYGGNAYGGQLQQGQYGGGGGGLGGGQSLYNQGANYGATTGGGGYGGGAGGSLYNQGANYGATQYGGGGGQSSFGGMQGSPYAMRGMGATYNPNQGAGGFM